MAWKIQSDALPTRFNISRRGIMCPICNEGVENTSHLIFSCSLVQQIIRKAVHLGYKSVAHYLIHTRGPNGKQEGTDTENDLLDDKDDDNMDEDGKHLNDKDDDDMDEDGKHVPAEKSIKLHDRKNKSKGDDDDANSDYKSDSQDDDDDNDNEDQTSEDD
nr:RNA-directed DNA polymerase, eukaryota [Tanacetum cinerariifolium]